MGIVPNSQQNASGENIAIDFLQQLRPDGPWVLTAIIPDGPTTTITAHTPEDVNAFFQKYNTERNIYYSVNRTRGDVSKKAAKTDIAQIDFLLADLDPKDGEKSEDAKTRYAARLKAYKYSPTAVVDSGNGLQCLWRLAKPIILGPPVAVTDNTGKTKLEFSPEDQAKIKDVEARTAAIMEQSLDATAGTQNIDRILRLPGTINLPNAKKRKDGRVPCQTKLIAFDGVSYSLKLFLPGTPDDGGQHARQEQPDEDSGDKLARIIRDGPRPDEFNSKRSGAVWWAINAMLRLGVPDRSIVSTVLDPANKISEHVRQQPNPRAYAERQVKEARAKLPPPKVEYCLHRSGWAKHRSRPLPH